MFLLADLPDPRRVGGGCDSDVLMVGICLVVVGSLMILTAIVITVVVLMCLARPQGKYTLKSKVVT